MIELVKEKLGKPYKDLELLLIFLKEVLIESGEEKLAFEIPWICEKSALLSDNITPKHLQLYSICFQLLNIVEVNGAVQHRRLVEDEKSASMINGLWANNLQLLKAHGFTDKEIAAYMSQIKVEPVLTAHPTEAKRTIMLQHLRNLYLLVVKRENKMFTKTEQNEINHEIKMEIHRIWRISDVFTEKPNVSTELDNILHYFTQVFPEVIAKHDRQLVQAWSESGFDISVLNDVNQFPKISFGNWVGGDRDGHPLVTAQVTSETLSKLRNKSLELVATALQKLQHNLSFNAKVDELNTDFFNRYKTLYATILEWDDHFKLLYPNEAFKQFIEMLLFLLPKHSNAKLDSETSTFGYNSPTELTKDLAILQNALIDVQASMIAYSDVGETIRIINTFGFHLAKLDIRQNSAFHEIALSQLIEAAQLDIDFSSLDVESRIKFISKELNSPRPFSHSGMVVGEQAQNIIETYRVLNAQVKNYGAETLGSLIVSMTRNVSDLLMLYLFLREAGMLHNTPNGLASPLPIVPLFETIDDLMDSHIILDEFLSHKVTQNSLLLQKTLNNIDMPIQQVMIGYSDSNKDGGILASQWYLYEAQTKLRNIGEKHGVKIRFFHGKGGSISRGAGPTHWFLKALPPQSINGDIRLTEQGETIERKYANKINAVYNLELLTSGTLAVSMLQKDNKIGSYEYTSEFDYLASESKIAYENLTKQEGFIQFFEKATPIDVIEKSKIGSRPSRRTGTRTLGDLRAIPWVFSWSQCRFNITGWYGVGTALKKMLDQDPNKFNRFKKAIKTDSFIRYVLTNIDSSLASSDEEMFLIYAQLADASLINTNIINQMLQEYHLTKQMMDKIIETPIAERRKNHYYSTLLRAEALKPLHQHQVRLLAEWRKLMNENNENANIILSELLRSVNAIAAAMGYTG